MRAHLTTTPTRAQVTFLARPSKASGAAGVPQRKVRFWCMCTAVCVCFSLLARVCATLFATLFAVAAAPTAAGAAGWCCCCLVCTAGVNCCCAASGVHCWCELVCVCSSKLLITLVHLLFTSLFHSSSLALSLLSLRPYAAALAQPSPRPSLPSSTFSSFLHVAIF